MNNTRQQLNRGSRMRPLLLTAAALLGIAAAPVLFSTPALAQSGPEFHACYVPGSGTVYRIKEPGLRQACSSPNHVAFSWKPEGDPGQSGVLGYEIVVSEQEYPSTTLSTFSTRSAECPSGKRVLGGGSNVRRSDGAFVSSLQIESLEQFPTPDGTRWQASLSLVNAQRVPFVWRIFAICASVDGGV